MQMAPDDNCLIAVVLTLLLFVVTMRELEWNMAYFLPTVAAIVYYAVSTHRDWTSQVSIMSCTPPVSCLRWSWCLSSVTCMPTQHIEVCLALIEHDMLECSTDAYMCFLRPQGMLSDSLDSRPETHANDIIMSADPHFRSPGQKAYLGWFFTKPGGTSTTGTPSAQRKGLHTVTSGSSKHFSIGAHPSPSTYFGNSEAQSSRNTPRSLSSAGWNRSSSLARSSNADSMNNSQPAESSNADSLDSSQPAESVVSLSPGSYQSNSAPASTGSGSPAGSSGSVRPASSLEIATPDAVAHAKSKDSSRSTAYKKPKRNQSKRKAYRAQQANQAAAAMVQAAAAAALPYYSEDTSDSTRSVRASDGAKSVDASDSASSTAASGFTKEPKPMQQFKGAAKTQISSKASLASSVDTGN